ncbi:cytochrome P450 [Actinospica robiniae]|uniref:cytochrome P450 n=1 Tax=Actinospica robiniae TaxID=304901 RepID=UPI00041BD2FD|nr:cytochrome P450 [Actinospica robiniae]
MQAEGLQGQEIIGALMTPAGRGDPYALYAAARKLGPVFGGADLGMYVCTGHDEVNAVLRSPEFGKFEREQIIEGWQESLVEGGSVDTISRSILDANPPDHRRVRSLISSAFTPRRIAGLEPAITRVADQLLDELERRGSRGEPVDFMEYVAFRLPVTVICELLGVPEEDRARFRPLAHDLTVALELIDDLAKLAPADAAALELRAYFEKLTAQRRAQPADDLVSALVQVNSADDGRLSDVELIVNLTLLLVAGFETTTNLLGNGLELALKRPAVKKGLAGGGIPVEDFVEEVLRYDSPVQLTMRVALTDEARIGGQRLKRGEQVLLLIGAANRDPARYPDPESFDPLRPDSAPLSFGGGIHYCLGQGLARLEAQIAFSRLFQRFPEIRAVAEPVRSDRLVLRGYERLEVVLREGE